MQRRARYFFEKKKKKEEEKTFRGRYPWETYDGIEENKRDNTLSLSLSVVKGSFHVGIPLRNG